MIWIVSMLWACSDYSVRPEEEVPVEVAKPPGREGDDFGDPPNWNTCGTGYQADYFNLTAAHPDFEPDEDAEPIAADAIEELDWWDPDHQAFSRFDPSLDQGSNWWPVDEGLADDPEHFSVRWIAWIRVLQDGNVPFLVGTSNDFWFFVNAAPVITRMGADQAYLPETVDVNLQAGQYPIEVRYAHRAGDSALRFRPLDPERAIICYPDFSEDTGF
ncbi:MAG: PA14 domain-containing protein [Myxococcota bacterium]